MSNKLTPFWQICVSELQVVKSSFAFDFGHRALLPLQKPFKAQSDSSLHVLLEFLNLHSFEQHGPPLGLHKKEKICNE